MQRIYQLTLCFLAMSLTGLLSAQSCQYEIQLSDSFGDGWNGGELTITAGEQTLVFTLTNENSDGFSLTQCFPVTDGEDLLFGYQAGAFANEVSFSVFNAEGELVLAESNGPATGDTIFQTIAVCGDCPPPSFCGGAEVFTRERSTSVNVNWNSPSFTGTNLPAAFLIEFDTIGFTQGTGNFRTTTDTFLRVQPLMDTTTYQVYIASLCGEGDTSAFRGPFTYTTPLSTDVGVSIITDPVSGCGVGFQQIRIGLENFGGVAQSFIPFDYSINGQTSGVNMPEDGLYTGVLGVDSIEFTTFDMFADFDEPGTYELKIWTDLPGDQDNSNDTLTVEIISTEIVQATPYFEDFESSDGGWATAQGGTGDVSWEHGVPMGNLISSAGQGESAWVTNLSGNYNNNELSYLLSPCFDFSDLAEDPVILFSLFVSTEEGFDELYLEASVDGMPWERVGAAGTGLNWYNDPFNNWWEGNGGFGNGWVFASQTLAGLAGEPKTRLRFVFSSDAIIPFEGVGVDNVYVGARQANDLAAANLNAISPVVCGSQSDSLQFTFFNLGSETANDITLSYQLNNGEIVTENYPDSLISFAQASYQFQTPYDATLSAINVIRAWTNLENDGLPQNDTLLLELELPLELPFYEGFDDGVANNWTIDPTEIIAEGHGSGSNVLFDNLSAGDVFFTATTPNAGLVEAGDTLFFDYRFVNAAGNEIQLSEADSFSVSLIIDCDTQSVPVFTLTGATQVPSDSFQNVAISLDEYIGRSVQATFEVFWSAGNYFFDLDNVNIRRCVASFEPSAEIVDASTNGSSDGSIELSLVGGGVAPYTYLWSNGDETPNLTDVAAGDYSVTITDAQGCTDFFNTEVGFLVSNRNFGTDLGTIAAAPNPTTGGLELFIDLNETRNLRIQLFNQFGQRIESRVLGDQRTIRQRFELTNQPAGMYFIRVFAGDQFQTLRVIKQ